MILFLVNDILLLLITHYRISPVNTIQIIILVVLLIGLVDWQLNRYLTTRVFPNLLIVGWAARI